ncbi:APC family permease [Mycolicibacterium litorale]|uniref:APC family permease n=1 Tax=Mycolicibacterium litorale TaxID=758802 RepID=UPI003CEA9FB3
MITESPSTGEGLERRTPAEGRLRGRMNALDVTFTVLAYNAPALAFMSFLPVMILLGNGVGTPVLFVGVGMLLLLVATGLMKMSNTLKRPGGFYAFTTAGLGKEVGLANGFTSIVAYFAATVANLVLSGIAFSDMVSGIFGGPEILWPVGSALIFVLVAVLGYLNINLSAKMLLVLLGLELVLVATYCIAVFAQGGANGISFDTFEPANIFSGSLAVAVLFGVGLFGGFEATVIFRDEVKDPDRTIPRATYGVVALITVLYATASFALINAYGAETIMSVLGADVVSASGESIREYVGEPAYIAAVTLLFTSAVAGSLAGHNILSRYVFNLAADGILPEKLSATHPRHDSPYKASIVASSAALVLLIVLAVTMMDNDYLYGYLAGILSYGMLIMVAVVSLAIGVFLFRKVSGRKVHSAATFLAAAVLILVLVFATLNFDLLSGMTGALGVVILVAIWLFILSGFALAVRLKQRRPDVYARIGRQ